MSRWFGFLSLLFTLSARALAVAPAPASSAVQGERRNVVLILWNDATLERLGFLRGEAGGGVTPRLDALLSDGARFPQGTLVCPRGRPTLAVVLSGRESHQTGVAYQMGGKSLAPEGTLGSLLHAQGYATLFVGRFREGPAVDFGFEREVKGALQSGADGVAGFVKEFGGGRPLFVCWSPELPEGFGAKNLDAALGLLLDAFDAGGQRENTLFAFVTNGEPKGLEFSAKECSASRMRTVLAFAGRGALANEKIPAGVHDELVTPLDVLPTVLALAGLDARPDAAGRSLHALLGGGTLEPRPVGGSFYPHQASGSRGAQELARNLLALTLRDGPFKYALFLEDIGVKVDKLTELIQIERSAGDQLLFDLAADPDEEHDLFASGEHAERLAAMRASALEWWSSSGGPEFPLPFLPPPLGAPPKEPHANIVLIVADDMDYEHLGFQGNPRVKTPTLDELARTGVVFPVAHVPMSRCRPALAALLSGRWPQQTGIYENEAAHTLTRRDSLPNLLKAAGYATFQGGKFWEGSQHSMGFLEPREIDTVFQNFVREDQGELFRFIDRYHAERPLFLWWAPMLPHGPFNPPARFQALFRETEIPVPAWIQGDARAFQEAERTAYAMGAWFDDGLRALRAKLEATGELEDTLFVFLIDNGYANGFPSKGTVFEKGLRTPVVFTWPKGIAGGRNQPELVCAVDLYRTLLDYAGVPAPETAAGISLRPTLEGHPQAVRKAIYGAVYNYRERAGPQKPENSVYALYARTERWKFVLYLRSLDPENFLFFHEFAPFPARERGQRELFDLAADPYEHDDLSEDSSHAALMDELLQGCLAWWKETGGGELDLSANSSAIPGGKKGKKKKQ